MRKVVNYLILILLLVFPFTVLAEEPNNNSGVSEINEKAELETLTVSECNSCKLSPAFKPGITFYVVNTRSENIRIEATGSNGATVSGTGLMNLTKESETFEIKVTTTTGVSSTYKIKVKKEKALDVTLKSLTIDKGSLSPAFTSDNTSYNATVDSDKVTIAAVATDSTAKVTGAGVKELNYGTNDFTVKVTATDGTSKSYLIKITRPDNRNANAYLKSLTIDGEDIGFEKDILEYTYKVGMDVETLKIEALPEKETSKVEITGNEKLTEGENVITIKVVAEDGEEKTYTIKVTKEEEKTDDEENSSEDVPGLYLKDLLIQGYGISFDKEQYEYIITIKDEKQLNIDAQVYDGYKVEIVGNEDLQEGSIIKVIVTDENEDSVIYKIKIKVDNTSNIDTTSSETNYIPIIMIALLVVLFIANVIFFVKKMQKK